MEIFHLTPTLLAVTLLLGACGSVPTKTSMLDQARADYASAQNSPTVTRYAPLELKQAGEAMDRANGAAINRDSAESVNDLAYIAKQKIAFSQEVTKQKMAEADVSQSAKQRDQMRLDQRTAEANRATATAQQAQMNAQAAQMNAIAAQASAKTAQAESADAKRKADMARDETNEAQRKTQEAQARTAQLEAQLSDLAAKKTDRGLVITLGDVLFGTDMARLNANGMQTAQKLAAVLQQNPQRTVLVEGFTDSTGTSPHNLELSERRADAVRAALLELGISRERVAIRGYGESFPVAANDTVTNRQLNRRVEIVLSDESGRTIAR
jgi:outer membrane protein OmpA-like peptidoglycan-associated protein